MLHPHDLIRQYITVKKALYNYGHADPLSLLERYQWDKLFWDACLARMVQGSYRYGTQPDQREKMLRGPFKSTINRYLKDYEETGNVENLMDMANRVMIEFGYANFDKQCFESQDDTDHEPIKETI